jgi:hypothetical protein
VFDGMAHGLPVDAKSRGLTGTLAPFVLEAGNSSTIRIAKSWGLLRQERSEAEDPPQKYNESGLHIWDLWSRIGRASK